MIFTPLTVFTFTICLKFHEVIISAAAICWQSSKLFCCNMPKSINFPASLIVSLSYPCFLFLRATSQVAACRHLATAARVKYPAALQRCKFDTPLLAAGSLIHLPKHKNLLHTRNPYPCASTCLQIFKSAIVTNRLSIRQQAATVNLPNT